MRIYLDSVLLSNNVMKTIDEIRRANLVILIKENGGTNTAFAKYINKDPGQVSQWKNGSKNSATGKQRGMNDETARYLEDACNKDRGWMDVDHENNVIEGNFRTDNGVEIPLLAAKGSMGNGNADHDPDLVVDMLRVTKQWLDKTLTNVSKLSNLKFIHAIGDSMTPTFNDGDILLVDSGATTVSVDGVYVLSAHDRLFIKRVRRKMDGNFEISSDNPSVKTVDILNGDHEVTIRGRVVWVWNGKRV